jgi:biotin carboxylase
MAQKKIAIFGASYLQLPLVLKAKEMGIETHCFAWKEGAVCDAYADFFYPISVTEKEAILDICKQVNINGVLTIATDLPVTTIAYVATEMNLIGNSVFSASVSTDKFKMRETLQQNNVPIPQYQLVDSFTQISKDFSLPYIIKPTDRSGSRGIHLISKPEELERAFMNSQNESFSKSILVEQFIVGHEVSVECISYKGEHVILAVTDKQTTGAPYFVELAHHQPSLVNNTIHNKICKVTIDALNALQIKNGASHTELKIDAEGRVFVIEVGARMGGDFIGSHLVELSTGFDFLKAVIEVATDTFHLPERVESKGYSGVFFLCKNTEKIQPYFDKKYDFEVKKEIFYQELKEITNSNDRSGYLIYSGNKKIDLL